MKYKIKSDLELFNKIMDFQYDIHFIAAAVQNDMELDQQEIVDMMYKNGLTLVKLKGLLDSLKEYYRKQGVPANFFKNPNLPDDLFE